MNFKPKDFRSVIILLFLMLGTYAMISGSIQKRGDAGEYESHNIKQKASETKYQLSFFKPY